MARREGQIDAGVPSLEGTEARLRPAIDQHEAEFAVESNGLRHGPYCDGHRLMWRIISLIESPRKAKKKQSWSLHE